MRLTGEDPEAVADACRMHLSYDPASGIITWKFRSAETIGGRRFNGHLAGKPAGKIDHHGRLIINIRVLKRQRYMQGSRIAWLLSSGSWPDGDIDHINHDPLDNRLLNLRCVPHAINQRNLSLSKANNSGSTGVGWCKRSGKWRSRVMINRKDHHLGVFDSVDEAAAAATAFRSSFGFHENHGGEREC